MPLPRADTAHILMISTLRRDSCVTVARQYRDVVRRAASTLGGGANAPGIQHHHHHGPLQTPWPMLAGSRDLLEVAVRAPAELRNQRRSLETEQARRGLLVALGATQRLGDEAMLELLHGDLEI